MKHSIGVAEHPHVQRFFLGPSNQADGITCVELELTEHFLRLLTSMPDRHRLGARPFFVEEIIAAQWHLNSVTCVSSQRTLLAVDPDGLCLVRRGDESDARSRTNSLEGRQMETTLYFHGGREFLDKVARARSFSFDIVDSGWHTLFEGELERQTVSVDEFLLLREANPQGVHRFFPGAVFASFEEWVHFKQFVFALKVEAALLRLGRPPLRTDIFDGFQSQ